MSASQGKKHVTLVGAGLVGSLLAIFLARRGYTVEILERRPDMRKREVSGNRSINLALSKRGLNALHQVGFEREMLEMAIPMHGRMVHPVKGELVFQRYGRDDSEFINSISRTGLNRFLMTHAEATGQVTIRFGQRVSAIDFERKRLRVVDEASETSREQEYERVIGTDGSASAIRLALSTLPSHYSTASPLDYGYKEIAMPPRADGSFALAKNALHIWPRGNFMLIALPNLDGTFTCTLFLAFDGAQSLRSITDGDQALDFFRRNFPDVPPLVPNLAQQFMEHPTGQMVTVKTAPWNRRGEVLLVGDAAHAIVPFFGQGMNCGFEDCFELNRLLDQHRDDWDAAMPQFSAQRKPNADAIADMAVENFVEMRDHVGNPRFLLAKEVEKLLQQRFPGEYVSRYQLVSFSTVPYAAARELGRVQEKMLAELCHGIERAEEMNWDVATRWVRGELAPVLKPLLQQSGYQAGT